MPRGKRYRSGRRKFSRRRFRRSFRRKLRWRGRGRRSSRSKISFRKMPTLDPDSIYVKLRFSVNLVSGTAVGSIVYLRGNGPYDPIYALGGGQPLGFDQYALLYKRYRCFGSKTTVKIVNQANATIYFALTPIDTAADVALDWYTEPFSRYKIIPPSATSGTRIIKNYMSTRKMFATNISQDDQYASLVTGLPNTQWYWKLKFGSVDGASAMNFIGLITMTYYIKFFNRQTLNDI